MDNTALLVVEDDALVRSALEEILNDAGYSVAAAASGTEAMNLLDSTHPYAALVTDIRLGDLTGWDVARRARQILPDIPVIYISGDSGADRKTFGVDPSTFVQKPFRADEIVAAIKTQVSTSQ
jgi:CheY-like chemotaxis protein